jgi:hypothetical protein
MVLVKTRFLPRKGIGRVRTLVSAGVRFRALRSRFVDVLVALLPSPLLGPAVWRPVAKALSLHGWLVKTAPAGERAPTGPSEVLRTFLAALPPDKDIVLVAHSNAGLYVPALVQERRVVANVFVDAGLPVRNGRVPLAPPAFRDFLLQKADADGLLPGWTHWWDETDLEGLFPSAEVREQVEREQPRLPLSYFQESLPAPFGWDDRPCAYLAFGDTYSTERNEAEARGWPVTTLPGQHLHTLVAPEQVASAIDALLGRLGIDPKS